MTMVRRVESFAKSLVQKFEPWLSGPAPFITSKRICLYISGNSITLLQVDNANNEIEILLNETLEFNNNDDLITVLYGIAQRYQFAKIPTYWLLTPDDYQLYFIDALPVKGDEFKDALNWRLRSMINFPIQDAATDYFMLPRKKGSTNQPMVIAVTARKQQLQTNINIFNRAGFTLNTIDIPELAMRNLTSTCENDEKSTAFLYFYKNMAILNLTRQKVLYFTRRLTLSANEETLPNYYEKLSLEILRYFDYFQSQWRYPSPTRFYIASYDGNTANIISGLNKHLMTKLEPFPLSQIKLNQNKSAILEKTSLLALGALLRQETTNVPAEY